MDAAASRVTVPPAGTRSLLVELLVEELPPKALKKLGEAFAHTLADSLRAQGLVAPSGVLTPYASPRRLAVHVTDVYSAAPDLALIHIPEPTRPY